MLSFLRSLLAGVGRACLYPLAYGWHWTSSFARGMWEAYAGPEPGPSEVGQLVEALKAHGLGGAQQAVAEAVAAAPAPKAAVVPDAGAARAAQLAALRYTTSVMYGGDRPSLDNVPDAVAARLRRLRTVAQAAPVHRDLVKACGFECKAGWWDGPRRNKANDDAVPVTRGVKLAY